MMGTAQGGGSAITGPDSDGDGDSILVLKVWRESGFRARITIQDPQKTSLSQTVLADTEGAVIDFIRRWLGGSVGSS